MYQKNLINIYFIIYRKKLNKKYTKKINND